MRRLVALLSSLVLASVVLAGCSDGKTKVGSPLDGYEFEVDDDTGVVLGLVVDETLTPVAGAKVTLRGQDVDLTASSDEVGRFTFTKLTPGDYFLTAKKAGFRGMQASTTVVAGDPDPDLVRLQLFVQTGSLPSHDVFDFDGFIECSVSAVIYVIPLCGYIGYGNDVTEGTWTLGHNVSHVQVEIIWDATTETGRRLYSNLYDASGDIVGWGAGESPLVLNVTEVDPRILSGQNFTVAVYADGQAFDTGVAISQKFKVVAVVFYNWVPDPSYRFHLDGEPTDPQV